MTDHIGDANKKANIIKAAREAEAYATSQTADIVDWKVIAQERFYAIAYRAGLEKAAEICEAQHEEDRPSDYAYAIRAHAQNQPKNVHDSGVVSKE